MVTNALKFNPVSRDLIDEYSKRINSEYESGKVGYYHLPNDSLETLNSALKLKESLEFDEIVVVGMGGSSLGTKAIYKMLKESKKKKIRFLDNLDIFSCKKVIKSINFSKTLFLIISKSGTTIETMMIFKLILDSFKLKNFENFIFITDSGSNLEKFATKNSAKVFNIPANVGGRFSVFSSAGIVPLTLAGFNSKALLNGARACEEWFFKDSETILQKAYHYTTHRSAKTNVIFSYLDRFSSFNEWYTQLWAESLGKKNGYKRLGLTPISLIGSRDQHSFLQLIMDGPKDKTLTFIKVLDQNDRNSSSNLSLEFLESSDFTNGLNLSEVLNAQCDATMKAVENEGISVDLITLEKLDEWHAGYLLYYYMLLTSVTGIMLNINTYDQPGVEVGKNILKIMLKKS